MAYNRTLAQLKSAVWDTRGVYRKHMNAAQLTKVINEGIHSLYDEIALRNEQALITSGTITLVSGTNSYAMPSDFGGSLPTVLYQKDTNDLRPLEFVSIEAGSVYGMQGYTDLEGMKVSLVKDNLMVWPTPGSGGTLIIYYIPTPTDLAIDTDTFDFVQGWDRYVIDFCLEVARDKTSEDVSAAQRRMAIALSAILSRVVRRQDSGTGVITPTNRVRARARSPYSR